MGKLNKSKIAFITLLLFLINIMPHKVIAEVIEGIEVANKIAGEVTRDVDEKQGEINEISTYGTAYVNSNEYIAYTIQPNKRISIGTTGGDPAINTDDNVKLTYGFDINGGSSTSYVSIAIDENVYEHGNIYGSLDDTINVEQDVSIVNNPTTNREDLVQVKYTITNIDSLSHNIGLRMMFDTMLGSNDSAPFSVPGYGDITTGKIFEGNDVPRLWQAYNSLTNPSIIAQGILYKNINERPDKMQFGNWSTLSGYMWDAPENYGVSNGDSAVAMTWNQEVLEPGESKTFVTYYGIGNFQQLQENNLGITLAGDVVTSINDETNLYNDINLIAYVKNNSSEVLNNVRVGFDLPKEMTLVAGEQEVVLDTLNPNETKSITCSVQIEPYPFDEYINYNVYSIADNIEEVKIQGQILAIAHDIVPPSPVENIIAKNIFSKSAIITWNESEDNAAVQGYAIYKDDVEVARTSELRYELTGLITDKEYNITIKAYDAAGNYSEPKGINITPKKTEINELDIVDFDNEIGGLEPIKIKANLINNTSFNYEDGKEPKITFYYRMKDEDWSVMEGTITEEENNFYICWNLEPLQSGDYEIKVVATDKDNTSTEKIISCNVDRTPPEKIKVFKAVEECKRVNLSWSISSEVDTNIYKIYRRAYNEEDFSVVKTINDRKELSYVDNDVEPGIQYEYYIVALDEYLQESEKSEIITATPLDDTEAPTITLMYPNNESVLNDKVTIKVEAKDNIEISKIEYYISKDDGETWEKINEINGESKLQFELNTTDIGYEKILAKAIAYDSNNNQSDVNMVYTYFIDNKGPERINNISYESLKSTSVRLKWSDVSDSDFSYFSVEEKGEDGQFTEIAKVNDVLGIEINDLIPGSSHVYRVVAYDIYGNRGIESDEIVAILINDDSAPYIKKITPYYGSFNDNITVEVTAVDNYKLSEVQLQISTNNKDWETILTNFIDSSESTVKSVFELSLENYNEGDIYIRAIAKDIYNNLSDSSDEALSVNYIIDRTAPNKPSNFIVNNTEGVIELRWDNDKEEVNQHYILYRSENNIDFEVVDDNIKQLNYFDRNIEINKKYYYKLQIVDEAGNTSEITEAIEAMLSEDLEEPNILSIYPQDNSKIGSQNNNISVLVEDNNIISKVTIEYRKQAFIALFSEDYKELVVKEDINDYSTVVSATLPLDELDNGDKINVRIKAIDVSGNESSYSIASYTIDKDSPEVDNLKITTVEDGYKITWNSKQEEDLSGYKIYRKYNNSNYELIYQVSNNNKDTYQYIDNNLIKQSGKIIYKVEAIDNVGNKSYKETEELDYVVDLSPTAILLCDSVIEVDAEYYFDASKSSDDNEILSYEFDFGDGTTAKGKKVIHKYTNIGEYIVKLTVIDNEGNKDTIKKKITVKDSLLVGDLKVKVVDESGNRLSNVPVYFNMDSEDREIKYTDFNGFVTFSADIGSYSVGAYIKDYLPNKKNVVITNNTLTTIEIVLTKDSIVTGEFEVNRMTLQEIKDAGIDVNAPENQHVFKINVQLSYGIKSENVELYLNSLGFINPTATVIYGEAGDGGSGGRAITPTLVGFPPNLGMTSEGDLILALVDIPIEARYLKEFFDVKIHILNNCSEGFNLIDNSITLNLPEGLTIMDVDNYFNSKDVFVDKIDGKSESTIQWIVRGDLPGQYDLSADFNGTLSDFNAPINAKFINQEKLKVYGTEGVSIEVNVCKNIRYSTFYFDLALANRSDIDINLPDVNVDGLVKIQEAGEETKELKAELLSTRIVNESGYSQYIEKPTEVLSPGEILYKSYAVYNVVKNKDALEFIDYIVKQTEGLEIEIVVNSIEFEFFNEDDPKERLDFILSSENKSIYEELISKDDYYYIIGSHFSGYSDYAKAELAHRIIKAFSGQSDELSNENKKDVIRSIIFQLLTSEEADENIQMSSFSKNLEIVKTIVTTSGEIIGGESIAIAISEILSDSDQLKEYADAYKLGGVKLVLDLLEVTLSTKDVIESGVEFHKILNNVKFEETINEKIGGCLETFGTVLESVQEVNDAIESSYEFRQLIMGFQSVKEETDFILDSIIKYGKDSNPLIIDVANEIKAAMNNAMQAQVNNLVNRIKEVGGNLTAKTITEIFKSVFGKTVVGGVYNVLTTAYEAADTILGITDKFKVINTVTYIYYLTDIFLECHSENVTDYKESANIEETAKSSVKSLKYIIKCKLLGERYFLDFVEEGLVNKDSYLASLNKDYGRTEEEKFNTFDDYYYFKIERIMRYKDLLLRKDTSKNQQANKPKVSIDYENLRTNEKFSNEYEYSIDNIKWIRCNGNEINITTSIFNKELAVRQVGNDELLTGEATYVIIPAEPIIDYEIQTTYQNGKYTVIGLKDNESYDILLSNENNLDNLDWSNKINITAKESVATIESSEKYNYIIVRISASNEEKQVASAPKIYDVKEQEYYTVKFFDLSNNVISEQTVKSGDAAVAPTSPIYPDYKFIGWDTDFSNVVTDLIVKPIYEKTLHMYKLEVIGGSGSGEYDSITLVNIVADEVENKEFVGWKNQDDIFVSYSSDYSFYITGDMKLTAIYKDKDENISISPSVVLDKSVTIDNSGIYPIMYFKAQVIVPEGYTYVEAGTIRYKGDDCPNDLNINTTSAKITATSQTNKVGQYTLAIKTTYGSTWNVRAYLKYKDKDGNLKIIYSDIVREQP